VFVAGRQSLLLSNLALTNDGNVFDYNLYFAPGGMEESEWQWRRSDRAGFASWQTFSRQDASSLFADPKFIDADGSDFHLSAGSPAIDTGDPTFMPAAGETDLEGELRVNGARVDIGADEF